MAANIERLAKDYAEKYPEVAELLRGIAKAARRMDMPEFLEVYPEISLAEEHQRQSWVLAARFAVKLGMSEKDYMATLPEFSEKYDTDKSLTLVIPVIIEPRLPWIEAAKAAGISIADGMKITDWEEDKFKMPDVPFSTFVHENYFSNLMRPVNARRALLEEEWSRPYRAGRVIDAISVCTVRPDLLRSGVSTLGWTVIGSNAGDRNIIYAKNSYNKGVSLWPDQLANSGAYFRSLVLEREFRILNSTA
ncbi:hypothetical protein HYU94_02770 [Candidatus Daviesbacteria bacterium]|nr:hypothetical protein [Candidatus Daviesbacteria bacterium]